MPVLWQIGLLFGVCLAGEGIAAVLPFAFPGSVIAMLLMLGLLSSGILKLKHVEGVTAFLMQNMAFFFVPLCVNLASYFDLISAHFAAIMAVCIISTVLTFAATALTVRGLVKLQNRKRGEKSA